MLLAHAAGWLGTIPGWLTLLALAVLGYYVVRGQMGPALGYYRETNEALVKERSELREALAREAKENAALRARTDLEPLQAALIGRLEKIEAASERRDSAMLSVLQMIADRLGPDELH